MLLSQPDKKFSKFRNQVIYIFLCVFPYTLLSIVSKAHAQQILADSTYQTLNKCLYKCKHKSWYQLNQLDSNSIPGTEQCEKVMISVLIELIIYQERQTYYQIKYNVMTTLWLK